MPTMEKHTPHIQNCHGLPPEGTILFHCRRCQHVHWKVALDHDNDILYISTTPYSRVRIEWLAPGVARRHIWCKRCGQHAIEPELNKEFLSST